MADRFTAKEAGPLFDLLAAHFTSWSRNTLRQRLRLGCIAVNGTVAARHDHPLVPGDTVEIRAKGEAAAGRGNAAVALGMARALVERSWAIPEQAMATGLAAARWPGRLERRRWRGRELLLDGAHNPPAAACLRRELDARNSPAATHWLLGIQRQKQAPEMLEALLGPADRAWLVPSSRMHGCRNFLTAAPWDLCPWTHRSALWISTRNLRKHGA
jgi:hypothetical protein